MPGALSFVFRPEKGSGFLLEHDLVRKPVPIPDRGRGHAFRDHAHKPLARRGSSASRMPSPSRLTASTVNDRNTAGKNTMNGLTCQSARPSAMMLPQDGTVGGTPAPMNDRIASTIIALAQM